MTQKTKTLDTVLLMALPASGKSEVRRYLAKLSPESCRNDFHMGPTVQLDDYPYVHMMRRIDDELVKLSSPRIFFHNADRPFQNPKDWGTLIEILNEDYEDLVAKKQIKPASCAQWLLEKIEKAGVAAGIAPRLSKLDDRVHKGLVKSLEKEAADLLKEKMENYPDTLEGKTLVVEAARGGPQGSKMPLEAPFGYRYSLGKFSDKILEKATLLYIWVTPEESRRKNEARADPNDPGSILHHGVPIEVMLKDYGCDDMDWLEANAKKPGTIHIQTKAKSYDIPVARFDNRVDKTSFIREDQSKWAKKDVEAVHNGLKGALDRLFQARSGH